MIQDVEYANNMCLISDNIDELEMMLQNMNENGSDHQHKEIQDNGCVAISWSTLRTSITKTRTDSTTV